MRHAILSNKSHLRNLDIHVCLDRMKGLTASFCSVPAISLVVDEYYGQEYINPSVFPL